MVYKMDGFTIRDYVPSTSQCGLDLQAGYKVPYDVITRYEQTQNVDSIRNYLFEYTSSDVSIKNTVMVSKWTDQYVDGHSSARNMLSL